MLRSMPVLEADRLITLLTPGAGKLRATVRGARRVHSRLGGHLDVFNRVQLTLAQGRTFDVVTGAEAMETFGALKGDLDRVAVAFYLMELADALVPEASPHPNAFRLLLEGLRVLNEVGLHPVVPRYLELHLLDEAGYSPELDNCVVCRGVIAPGPSQYAPVMGGVVCGACAVPQGPMFLMSEDALKSLRFFAGQGFKGALRLQVKPALAQEMEWLLGTSMLHVVERGMAASAFIEHLRRLPGVGPSRPR